MQMTLNVADFEGPLDLLLHLVKTSKMDIYNIDIASVTEEYLSFINNNTGLSIDAYSEYLVMASELIHLKSKLLLNNDDEEESDYEFNNPEDLAARLLEYEKIKNISSIFKNLEEKRSEVYTKSPSYLEDYRENKEIINSDISLDDLLSAFSSFLERQKLSEPTDTKITKKELSVEDRINTIRTKLKKYNGKIKFLELFDNVTKPYVIVTFLSILDMAKNKEITINQKNNFSDIFIESSDVK